MNGFVASAPAAPGGTPADTIANDGWFPDLKLSEVRASLRLDGTVVEPRLRDAVLYAMDTVNTLLLRFKLAHVLAGATSLAAVSSESIGGVPRLVMLYQRAVNATCNADLMERYRSFDTSSSGERRAEDNDGAIGEQMRNARWAVCDILGQPHSTVELI